MADRYPRFFIDETSFRLDGAPSTDALTRRIEAFIALLDACREKGGPVIRSKDLFEIELCPGILLSDLLFHPPPDLTLDRIVLRALQTTLFRCVEWDPPLHLEHPGEVDIAGVRCEASSVNIVHALVERRHGAACLCLDFRPDRSGAQSVCAGRVLLDIHFLTDRAMLPVFYRSLFDLEDMDADAYMDNAGHAFPDIAFSPGLNVQFPRFRTRYHDVRPEVTRHLAALNDHFQSIFKQADYAPDRTQDLLNSIYHVDASKESPLTRRNKKAMRERDVLVDHVLVAGRKVPVALARPVRCEWHTKIKPTTDRIHFHPGDKEVAEGRLFVGIFHAHLKT